MSEDSVTVQEDRRALAQSLVAEGSSGLYAVKTGSVGADLVITGRDDVLRLVLENKLAHGPAQWTSAARATRGVVADGASAHNFDSRLRAAASDPALMAHGVARHAPGCSCSWSNGWHTQIRNGEYVCANAQLDYYAYYRDWLPSHVQPAATADVLHIFLCGAPTELATRYDPLDSVDLWDVVSCAAFLNTFVEHRPPTSTLGVLAAFETALREIYTEMPWSQVDCLSTRAKEQVERIGLPLTPP